MRHLLFFLFLSTAFFSLSGQNLDGGLIFGFNGTQVDGDANSGFRKVGGVIGGFVQFPLTDQVTFRPEIRIEQLGSRDKTSLIVDVGYFSFPFLIEKQIPLILGEKERTLTLLGGPVFGATLYARDLFGDRTAALRRFDSRVMIGLGAPVSEKWEADFRLGYSLFSFVKTGTAFANSFAQGRRQGAFHRYLSFNLYYRLGR